jgi:malonate decarboxylase gamma subunit
MNVDQLLAQLFPAGHQVAREGALLLGSGRTRGGEVAVLGVCDGEGVGVEQALRLSEELLRVVRQHPGRPILTLLDSAGQRMSKRDEVLGLNGYLGHLAACVELARRSGHRSLALVHGQASSGSFLALAAPCDEVHAVAGAVFSVMNLPAMSKVTRIPLERLEALSRSSPVLAPGLENYVRLGGVTSLWTAPLAGALEAALARAGEPDRRAALGLARGGRMLADPVARRVEGSRDGE